MSKDVFGSISKKIKAIPFNDPPRVEGLIRSIDKMVKNHKDKEEKRILEDKLKDAAIFGVDKDLQDEMKSHGLALDALQLVLEHLTTKVDLASFIAETQDVNLPADMKMIKRKLGKTLEADYKFNKTFESDEEIVEKSSGGLALKGINYLHWNHPKTAMIPILERPPRIDIWDAQSPYETGFRQFSEGNGAAIFTKEVERSGFTHADSVSFSTGTSVSYRSQTSNETENVMKSNSTSVSATNFCKYVTKCFAVPRDCMVVKEQASTRMALRIIDSFKEKEEQMGEIRRFFKIYGSHVPFSVHQLGGVFFSMSTATSTEEMETSKLMQLNSDKLSTEVSHEDVSSKGSTMPKQDDKENVSYTFSVKSIGPLSDTPASFKKALSNNNATWAVLDRGDTSLDVPVWELLRELDEKFKDIANLMRATYMENKMENEKEQVSKSVEHQRCFEQQQKDKKQREILKEELKEQTRKYKEKSTAGSESVFVGQLPLKGAVSYSKEAIEPELQCAIYIENKEDLESRIFDFLIIDPSSHFCQLIEDHSYSENVAVLKCYKANDNLTDSFTEGSRTNDHESHYIFFSGNYFYYQCLFPFYQKHVSGEVLPWHKFEQNIS